MILIFLAPVVCVCVCVCAEEGVVGVGKIHQ